MDRLVVVFDGDNFTRAAFILCSRPNALAAVSSTVTSEIQAHTRLGSTIGRCFTPPNTHLHTHSLNLPQHPAAALPVPHASQRVHDQMRLPTPATLNYCTHSFSLSIVNTHALSAATHTHITPTPSSKCLPNLLPATQVASLPQPHSQPLPGW